MKGKSLYKDLIVLAVIIVVVPVITVSLYLKYGMKEEIVAESPVIIEQPDDEEDYTTPVINESDIIINPYLDSKVKIGKSFYDYKGDAKLQENSLVVNDNTYYQNTGTDFISDEVFDVIAISQGTVINVKEDDNTGKVVEIKHDNGLVSIYQSLSEVTVKKGDIITKGQNIGKSGTNKLDASLGNHLHLEIYENSNPVNPENYLNKDYKKEN